MPPPPSVSRRSTGTRSKGGSTKRGGGENTRRAANVGTGSAPVTRRERGGGGGGGAGGGDGGYEAALLTSWGLPDHLAHLEPMFPTDVPQALDVADARDARAAERGVKVRWPAKRMSVGDMNKRVRSLVEWVGREQASLLERQRRRDALDASLRAAAAAGQDAQGRAADAATMKMMEELMEELIGFQEKFGPGAKSKERDRRVS
jgi:hypothetical protein